MIMTVLGGQLMASGTSPLFITRWRLREHFNVFPDFLTPAHLL